MPLTSAYAPVPFVSVVQSVVTVVLLASSLACRWQSDRSRPRNSSGPTKRPRKHYRSGVIPGWGIAAVLFFGRACPHRFLQHGICECEKEPDAGKHVDDRECLAEAVCGVKSPNPTVVSVVTLK